ncbi:MAG: FAD-dependent oxidoreductase [Acidimicrobiia bacterium]|nr:FAD-dependent oxidoreductase [Acidimicrobiia bacterium]
MAEIIVIGGGVAGLSTAMLLAGDGHRVRVLERDDTPPPDEATDAWTEWTRRGVNQFRMIHLFLPRFRELLEAELPAVAAGLEEAGALRFSLPASVPDSVSGGTTTEDERFTMLTGRRPIVESVLARTAAATPGVEVLRGAPVAELLTGPEAVSGVPHVTGVRTEAGDELSADLVVDAAGRRSPLPRLLEAIGAGPVGEELEDSGFVYYGRHFRSEDGTTPAVMAPLLSAYGSISILTLPADNGTWGIGFVTSSKDAEVRGLRDPDRWSAALREFPLVAHWGDGEPIEDGVAVMAKIEDRIRSYVRDGVPVATGIVPVADAWACTNPSLGRGATLGLMHSVALRDLLRRFGPDQPGALALEWDAVTRAVVEPWYRSTVDFDRHRLAEIEATIAGKPYQPDAPSWELTNALLYGALLDPELFRGFLSVLSLLELPEQVFARPGFMDKLIELGAGWRDAPSFGPSRERLVELVNA